MQYPRNGTIGEVFATSDPVGFEGDVTELRIFVKHNTGYESYHTYRYDGMSHHHESNDIIRVHDATAPRGL